MAVDVSAEVAELVPVEAAVDLNVGVASDEVVRVSDLVKFVVFELVMKVDPIEVAEL